MCIGFESNVRSLTGWKIGNINWKQCDHGLTHPEITRIHVPATITDGAPEFFELLLPSSQESLELLILGVHGSLLRGGNRFGRAGADR